MAVDQIKRITPEEVKLAYEKTGLTPINKDFGDGVTCGCAITALVVASSIPHDPFDKHKSNQDKMILHMVDRGYRSMYLSGFMNAYDEKKRYLPDNPSYSTGFEDGEASKKLIFGEVEICQSQTGNI